MRTYSLLLLALLASLLAGCLGSDPATEAQVDYTIDLGVLPDTVRPDSGWIQVYVAGELVKSYGLDSTDLVPRQFALDPLMCGVGDSVRVTYTVWAQGTVVAQGTDAFAAVSDASGSLGQLLVTIENGTSSAQGSSSSSVAGELHSSSSSFVASEGQCADQAVFSIGFKRDGALFPEGDTAIWLLVGGPAGKTLGAPVSLTLKASQGAGTAAADLTVDADVVLTGDLRACDSVRVPLSVLADQLVEGPETARLVIAGTGGLASGSFQGMDLSLADGDSAWLEWAVAPDALREPKQDSAATLILKLRTRNSATLAAKASLPLEIRHMGASTATDFSLPAAAEFEAGAGNGAPDTLLLTLKANKDWNPLRQFALAVATSAPVNGLDEILFNLYDNDYEYLGLSLGDSLVVFSPAGEDLGERYRNGLGLVTGAGPDTLLGQRLSNGNSLSWDLPRNQTTLLTTTMDFNGLKVVPSSLDVGIYRMLAYTTNGVALVSWKPSTMSTVVGAYLGKSPNGFYALHPASEYLYYVGIDGGGVAEWTCYSYGPSCTSKTLNAGGGVVDGGLAVSAAGVVLAKQANGLYRVGETSVALAPVGVELTSIKDIVATPRNTFWLVTVDAESKVGLVEIDATGTLLRKAESSRLATKGFHGITYFRTSVPLGF